MIGPILAILILGAFFASLIPAIRKSRREDRELEQRIRCGPGCICDGERARAYQAVRLDAQQQTPAPMIIQTPAPMAYQQPQAQPMIIVIQQPAPQYQPQQPHVVYLPAPQPAGYLPAPTYPPPVHNGNGYQYQQPQYQPTPQPRAQHPQSYYHGYSPEPADYPQEVYRLPPQQPVGQLPPARASDIEEARRRFERERGEMRR